MSMTFELFVRHIRKSNHLFASSLFLLSTLLISLSLRALLADTDKAGLRAGITELPVCVLFALVVAELALGDLGDVLDGQSSGGAADDLLSILGGLDVLGGSITLLGLAVTAGEKDEALPELLEALNVGLEALLGEVLAARVDRDTDGAGELAGNTGGCVLLAELCDAACAMRTLQLNERETTTRPDTAVVCSKSTSASQQPPLPTYT